MSPKTFTMVIPVYPGVDLLDVTGPYEFFSWLKTFWTGVEVTLLVVGQAGADGEPAMVQSVSGLSLLPQATFANCPQADLLLVPGGDPDRLPTPESNTPLFDFLHHQKEKAGYITSVCVGALVLAAGGMLDHCNATTHWQSLDRLRTYPTIRVADGYPRYIWCRVGRKTYVTGGGISSNLDTALFLIEMITGSSLIAGQVQLLVQYNPQPPLNDGDPSVASPQVLAAALGE